MVPKVEIYTRPGCGYCALAKQLLNKRMLEFTEYDVYADPVRKDELARRVRYQTYPQIFINDLPVGGYDDLARLDQQAKLSGF
ncbi:glutaredoxin family protein [Neptunicella marina]|uniref:Glutaredoxin family protein n=1 Tax=Neptunicella marina TaxID=2125989 RepID=A0A8J6M3A6_9ALTE|nr:glutaredoxin family protein [Neptunicella marina]